MFMKTFFRLVLRIELFTEFTRAFFNLIFKLIKISKKHVKKQKLITIYEKFFLKSIQKNFNDNLNK